VLTLFTLSVKVTYPNEDEEEGGIQVTRSANDEKSGSFFPCNKEEIRDQTVTMIRTLITLAATFETLPKNRHVAVNLLYRDDVTPDDYEPRFFCPAEEDGMYLFKCSIALTVLRSSIGLMKFEQTPFAVRLGDVRTPYHEMVKTLFETSLPDENVVSRA
jgi:hypothetical protein